MLSIVEQIKSLIENQVKLIVDKPNEVEVNVLCTTKSVLVQIKANQEDLGQIIGRKGRTIDALKILATAVKNTQFLGDKKDVFIEIIEDEKSNFVHKKVT